MTHFNKLKGFTLIELLVVISIIGLLSSVVLSSLNSAREGARDAIRLNDMRTLQIALERHLVDFGVYPQSDMQGSGTWETPEDGDFITALTTAGYLPHDLSDPVSDPLDPGRVIGNYFYYRYDPGYQNCPIERGGFYILGVYDLEGSEGSHPNNPDWRCGNYNGPGEWVTGKFEK